MKQWHTKQDDLNNLDLTDAEKPTPKEGEVLVKIHTVSLNYRDTEVCMGVYGYHKSIQQSHSLVLCSDICGTILSTNDPSHFQVGQRVMATFI